MFFQAFPSRQVVPWLLLSLSLLQRVKICLLPSPVPWQCNTCETRVLQSPGLPGGIFAIAYAPLPQTDHSICSAPANQWGTPCRQQPTAEQEGGQEKVCQGRLA